MLPRHTLPAFRSLACTLLLVMLNATGPVRAAEPDPYFDKVAIITGSSSGLGYALSEIAAEHGMRLVLADIDIANSDRHAMSIRSEGGVVKTVQADLAQPADRARVIETAMDAFGQVDFLFNNAGYAYLATLEDHDIDDAHRLFEVNYWAYVDLAQRAVPIMKAQGGGTILNVASILGVTAAGPTLGHYSASKHALVGLFQTAAQELADDGIKVFVAAPGGMKTNIARNAVGPDARAFRNAADDWEDPRVVAEDIFELMQDDDAEVVLLPGYVGRQ